MNRIESVPDTRRRAAGRRLEQLLDIRPRTPEQLHQLVYRLLGMSVPRKPLIPGNDAPLEYLKHAFFEGGQLADAPQAITPARHDLIVWANRGGGKTMLGAIATLLDLLFKPGIQVRILGGSFEQSDRMYAYLRRLLRHPLLRDLSVRHPTQRRVELLNGSAVEVLRQSERSVRGNRVHKMRCDEVELFKDEVWQAAQMVTQSGRCGDVEVRGSVEGLSTMHRPFGLMSRLIESLSTYHFNPDRPDHDQPVKDGPDHACDALRYMVLNHEAGSQDVTTANY